MITKEKFGTLPAGEVFAYTLSNGSITSAVVLNYGGIIKNLFVEDKNGKKADVICGFDTLDGYLTSSGYQGALIGRVCNRIGKGKFTLDGKEYSLYKNDGNNTLHGGKDGFNAKIWDVTSADGDEPTLTLTYISPDGEEGFPGELKVTVKYTLTKDGAFDIQYEATTDKTTVVNLTNHAYFNLAGYGAGPVDDHVMWLDCDRLNVIDGELIPTGEIIDITGTPYDFTKAQRIGVGFDSDYSMLATFGGYDNNFVCKDPDYSYKLRAEVTEPESGRKLSLYTDAPCVQIYTANMINTSDPSFKGGVAQYKHCALCLETQAMPDSMNHDGFTNVVLKPDEKYATRTTFKFSN